MANLKAAGSDRCVQFVLGLFANERVKFALSDLIEKRAYLLLITCSLKFYAPVRQVAHPTGHVKALGDVAHSETEPDALDVAFIKHLKRDHHLLQERTGESSIYTNRGDRNALPGPRPSRPRQSTGRSPPAQSRLAFCPRCSNYLSS